MTQTGSGTGTPVSPGTYTALVLTSAADYSMIRSMLDMSVADLPDATIADYGYLPLVEAEVVAKITNYAALISTGGANLYRLKTGVAAWVAALLCEQMSVEEAESFHAGAFSVSASAIDWKAKAAALIQRAAAALGAITTRTFTRPTVVALAGPTRSGGNYPTTAEGWFDLIDPTIVDWVEGDDADADD